MHDSILFLAAGKEEKEGEGDGQTRMGGGAVARARGKIMVSETAKANHIQMGKLVRATVERNGGEQERETFTEEGGGRRRGGAGARVEE